LTTKEGGIAVDYQGTSVSHPIITYGTQNSPQLVQAIGRGCRDLEGSAEGSLIVTDPLPSEAAFYIAD